MNPCKTRRSVPIEECKESMPWNKKNPECSRDLSFSAPRVGLEPTTLRLTAACSAIELPRN